MPSQEVTQDIGVIAGFWAVGVVQPLLDLLGRNPEFFVAAGTSDTQLVFFVAVVVVAAPLAAALTLVVVKRGAPRVYPAVRTILLVGGAVLVGLATGRSLFPDRTVLHLATTAFVTFVLVAAYLRLPVFRSTIAYLGLAGPVFAVLFFTSPAGDLLFADEPAAAAEVRVQDKHDVVMVVLDELPLASLLGSDGQIAAERFPTFARLSTEGLWFRNTLSDQWETTAAVPVLTTGTVPTDPRPPTAAAYPRSLFTLLGGTHDVVVHQELTDLCPESVCDAAAGSGPESGFVRMLNDAGIVLEHLLAPASVRDDLPPIDQGWRDFAGPEGRDDRASNPFGDWNRSQAAEASLTAPRVEAMEALAASIRSRPASSPPSLWFTHTVLPHVPWERGPDGSLITALTDANLPVDRGGVFTTLEEPVIHQFQRHLLQLGMVDRLLGDVVAALEETGRWDDTVLVVAADHGGAFIPGVARRRPTAEAADEIYRIPLFFHIPGIQGGVDDTLTRSRDVLPTIVDALDISVDWQFDGHSLLDPDRPTEEPVVRTRDGTLELDGDIEALMATVERNHERLPNGDDWRSVAAPGEAGRLVGRPSTSLDVTPGTGATATIDELVSLADVDRTSGFLPLVNVVRLEGAEPDCVLIAIDGVIAGVGLRVGERYQAVVNPALEDGRHDVEVFGWSADGEISRFRLDDVPPLVFENGAFLVSGEPRPTVAADDDHIIAIDRAAADQSFARITGWAADLDAHEAPELVGVLSGGDVVVDVSLGGRADLDETRELDSTEVAFALRAPMSNDLRVVAVFSDHVVISEPLFDDD